jgi:hypothetical protein
VIGINTWGDVKGIINVNSAKEAVDKAFELVGNAM